jgi:hypothetical protein
MQKFDWCNKLMHHQGVYHSPIHHMYRTNSDSKFYLRNLIFLLLDSLKTL